jgi:hypothetical protein
MNNKIQVVEAVYERDIDLLLVEEFCTDLSFYKHFLNGTNIPLPENLTEVKVLRSKSDLDGEIDIFIEYWVDSKPIILLIENKIDASFQKLQAERYLKRKAIYKGEVTTFLVAPFQYLDCNHQFEYTVSYEDLISYFETLGLRGQYKIELLRIAIDKLRRGYVALNDSNRLRFNTTYWQCVREFEQFNMDEPKRVPKKSSWIKLKHKSIPELNLYHKIQTNYFDIEIPKIKANKYLPFIDSAKAKGLLKEFSSVYYIRTKLDFSFEDYLSDYEIKTKIRNALRLFDSEISKLNQIE